MRLLLYHMLVNLNGIYYVHVCEQARWARSAGTSAIENVCIIIIIFMEINSAFSSVPPPTGTTSVTTRWGPPHLKTSNDWSPPQAPSNSRPHSSLVASKPKVLWRMKSRSLTATSRKQAPMRSRLQFLTNFHLQLNWYSSSVKCPLSSYWRVCHWLDLRSS